MFALIEGDVSIRSARSLDPARRGRCRASSGITADAASFHTLF